MPHDPFGNLREWGSVLELLEELDSTGRLAECQRGLVRILRYRENWRLREEVLRRVDRIDAPTEKLIEEVIRIVTDRELPHEDRILASRVLSCLVMSSRRGSATGCCAGTGSVAERLEMLMKTPQAPVLHEALTTCLRSIT